MILDCAHPRDDERIGYPLEIASMVVAGFVLHRSLRRAGRL